MRTLSIIIGLILLIVNALAGILISDYKLENILMSSCVLLINTLLLWVSGNSDMREAFKISFHILTPIFCIIEFVLAIMSPSTWENNFYFIGIIVILAFQAILLITAIKTTQHNTQND